MGKEKPRNIEFSGPNAQLRQAIEELPYSFVRHLFKSVGHFSELSLFAMVLNNYFLKDNISAITQNSLVLGTGYIGMKGAVALMVSRINRVRRR